MIFNFPDTYPEIDLDEKTESSTSATDLQSVKFELQLQDLDSRIIGEMKIEIRKFSRTLIPIFDDLDRHTYEIWTNERNPNSNLKFKQPIRTIVRMRKLFQDLDNFKFQSIKNF